MTISISTSEYIKYKQVIIDGTEIGLRLPSSAESLAIAALQREYNENGSDQAEILAKLIDMLFNLYNDPEKARKMLDNLSLDALLDIYQKVMGSN